MDLFNILSMIGGLALFLFGMHVMSDSLAKLSGGKMEKILEKLTSNRFKAVILGAGVTAVIQSSSATTVMVVGFVNSGIMKLSQAVGVILGANVGTTITSWILSLTGIESTNFWVQLLKPTSFSPVLAIIGAALLLFAKKDKHKDVGTILVSFAVLMFGMNMMSDAVAPLKDSPTFTNFFTLFSNPVLGLLAGAVLTAVIQSSSASVGILQALCSTGAIGYSSAVPIILGQNIGTCVTALLSSVGASKNAKRAAFVHLYFNVIGTIVFMGLFYGLNAFIHFEFLEGQATELGIAVIHTLFNIIATAVLLPFSKMLEKLACLTIRDSKTNIPAHVRDKELKLLDVRFLEKPAFAVDQCIKTADNMAETVRKSIFMAMELFNNYDVAKEKEVIQMEELVDRYEDELGIYLVNLSTKNLSEEDSRTVSELLHTIGDLERMSDHSLNLMEAAREMNTKNMEFSDKAKNELQIFMEAIRRIIDEAIESFINNDRNLALLVEPLEEVIDGMNNELKERHIRRLREGKCTIELGFVLSDITTNCERIADHCSNIAISVLQVKQTNLESHDYLGRIKSDDPAFKQHYNDFLRIYRLP
ncbi:MAG: Na/Pi cotransporter family protein [Butyrivibrio sp.]